MNYFDKNDARRFQDEDRRVTDYDKLMSNYIDKGYFIHFTNNQELSVGVNIKTEYDTPLGIYCYPLDSSFVSDRVPFMGDSKYITVFKPTNDNYIRTSKYSKGNFFSDVKKLEEEVYHGDNFEKEFITECIQNARVDHPVSWLLYLIYNISGGFNNPNKARVTNLFKKLGYSGIFDDLGEGIIHENEATQAVFFSEGYLEVIDFLKNPTFKSQFQINKDEYLKDVDIYNLSKKFKNDSGNKKFTEEEYAEYLKKGGNIKNIPEELITYNLCKIWIESGGSLSYIPTELKSPELCEIYLKNGGDFWYIPISLFESDPKVYYKLAKIYIENRGDLGSVVPEVRTPELCKIYIENGGNIKNVPFSIKDSDPDFYYELCKIYIKKGGVIKDVPSVFITSELCEIWIGLGGKLRSIPRESILSEPDIFLELFKIWIEEGKDFRDIPSFFMREKPKDYLELCKLYIKNNGKLSFIPNEFHTPEIIELYNEVRNSKQAYYYISIYKLSNLFNNILNKRFG